MTTTIFFYAALAFILTHEMDAIRCREWAIFPGLSRLDDRTGFVVFLLLHVPLYLLLLWGVFREGELQSSVAIGLDIFFLIHALLHVLYLRHPRNEFTSVLSWSLILGAAVMGLLDLVVRL